MQYLIANFCSRLSGWPALRPWAAALVLFGLLAASPAVSQSLKVRDIRIGVHNGSTRFVIELSDSAEPRIFGLPDPYRVVLDLPEADFDLAQDQTGAGGGLIERLRYGLFRPGTSRIVLDLRGPAKVGRHFLLRPSGAKPWRLVVDLVATEHADFVQAMRPAAGVAPPVASDSPPLRMDAERPAGRRPVIVVDAGHGGVDPGAIGRGGVYEKTMVLAYARELNRQLAQTNRYTVVMTRDRDIFLPLRERVRLARQAEADLFLSLHVNTHPKPSTRGLSVYTLSENASDREAAALAALENKADVIGGMDLGGYSDEVQNILIDFAQTKTNELSVRFARDMVVREVGGNANLLARPWRSAGFAVLKAPDVPSVLVELGYISHRDEARQLRSPDYRAMLVSSLVRSIDRFFDMSQRAGLN